MNRGFQMKRLILVSVFLLISCGGGGGGDSSSSSSSSPSTTSYTGVGSTVLNLDWSTHTNPDGSSHQTTVNNIILQTAPGATLVPVTYSGDVPTSTAVWFAYISSVLGGMSSGQIINFSAGSSLIATTALITASANPPKIVISVSAGNTPVPTLQGTLPAGLYNSAYKSGVIIVGALGTDGNIASWSATAGAAADRFVIADATCTGTVYSGTSCSAPRVAGYAAIIKQKFPNATSDQIASAILNTAVLKSGWDPAIYGKGLVDITAALKYLGS